MKKGILLLTAIVISLQVSAQRSIRDSTMTTFLLDIAYVFDAPQGDLKDRFGWNSGLGGRFQLKTPKNVIYSVQGDFLFGPTVRQDDILDPLKTELGEIIDINGGYALVLLMERGFTVSGNIGYQFKTWGPNPNSGLMATMGLGYMQHKIRIDVRTNSAPQLQGDYRKGYDRLTSGFMLTQFLGYRYLSNKRLVNFFAGVEATEGFTQSKRPWNFDTMGPDTGKRTDILLGLKVGWTVPLYRRAPREFYFN